MFFAGNGDRIKRNGAEKLPPITEQPSIKEQIKNSKGGHSQAIIWGALTKPQ